MKNSWMQDGTGANNYTGGFLQGCITCSLEEDKSACRNVGSSETPSLRIFYCLYTPCLNIFRARSLVQAYLFLTTKVHFINSPVCGINSYSATSWGPVHMCHHTPPNGRKVLFGLKLTYTQNYFTMDAHGPPIWCASLFCASNNPKISNALYF